ncbi:40S ribosomal protein S16 [Histoplasma capsulatum G186AR]|uniref:40S ribosomal protein S16 n=1 Tax=Ajellomyces capsulatus TaxID=5037 RepID=A0A8H8D098_AJECA|nr:40S ribosomal protein S16 [Histoplasma capsulatum]QSS74296.1 40S ribosomal protein S16 [Histoplasma capsulatum G186AR]
MDQTQRVPDHAYEHFTIYAVEVQRLVLTEDEYHATDSPASSSSSTSSTKPFSRLSPSPKSTITGAYSPISSSSFAPLISTSTCSPSSNSNIPLLTVAPGLSSQPYRPLTQFSNFSNSCLTSCPSASTISFTARENPISNSLNNAPPSSPSRSNNPPSTSSKCLSCRRSRRRTCTKNFSRTSTAARHVNTNPSNRFHCSRHEKFINVRTIRNVNCSSPRICASPAS